MAVVLDHAVRIEADAGHAVGLRLQVGPDVHPGVLNQTKNGLFCLDRLVDERRGVAEDLLVDRLHALPGERAGVLDCCGPSALTLVWRTPRGPYFFLNSGSFG